LLWKSIYILGHEKMISKKDVYIFIFIILGIPVIIAIISLVMSMLTGEVPPGAY
jgi:hypothetical protein